MIHKVDISCIIASREDTSQEVPDTEAGPEQAGSEGRRGLRLHTIVPATVHCPQFSPLPAGFPHPKRVNSVRRTNMIGTLRSSSWAVITVAAFALLTACNPPSNDEQLKEQAAQAT